MQTEPESASLKRYLQRYRADDRVTSALSRVEVIRALFPGGPDAVGHGRRILNRVYQASVDPPLLDLAATLGLPGSLRSLDAIHLATAQLLGAQLRALITYDIRMAQASAALGMVAESPA